MRIFLVGFMGSGKSTLGKKLANHLDYDFIDLDKLIEDKAGMSISDYFAQNGEDKFRELERTTLQTTAFNDDVVIATGGGAPCFFDNMDWMKRNGATVYLKMSPGALAQRLKHATDRPLIKGLTDKELVKYIEEKLEGREEFYGKAQYVVNGGDITAAKLTNNLNIG
jgi:shikimate kinase